MKLLMHTCCAPCSVYCIKSLREEGIEPTCYWYNPNIHPYIEYKTRRDTLIEYSKMANFELIVNDEYGLREFCKNVINDLGSRCVNYCYRVRLENTVKYAKEHGFDAFTSTLFVSPYQQHDKLKALCEELAEKYDIEFLYRDFRVGFRVGQAEARELGLYMQKYCGCVFSEEQTQLAKNNSMPGLPEGFEFLPVERSVVIRKERDDKEQYMSLLLEADPSEKLVRKYLADGDLFVLTYKNDVACVAVVTRVSDNTCELKNIATKEQYRGMGYGKQMIKYLADNCKQKYERMIVGTTENNIPFYVKQGFDRFEKTVKNFFVDNYEEELWDGDLQCIDMYYYSMKLKRNNSNK